MKDGIDSFAGGAISVGGPFAKVTIHSSSLTGHQAGQGGAIFVILILVMALSELQPKEMRSTCRSKALLLI